MEILNTFELNFEIGKLCRTYQSERVNGMTLEAWATERERLAGCAPGETHI